MQAIGKISRARRMTRVLGNAPPIPYDSARRVSLTELELFTNASQLSSPLRRPMSSLSGIIGGNHSPLDSDNHESILKRLVFSAPFCSGTGIVESGGSETVKELYDKMLKSIADIRSPFPNAWLWSYIEKCSTHEDIERLFDILQRLRIFRLSNLRIHENFNCALCREVTKACVRVGAIDFGKKALLKHNLYGLSPNIGSAHYLLLYAKEHNNVKVMVETMKLIKTNDLPLQPGTADLVFSICDNTDRWDLITQYGKSFVKSGVTLRQSSFDTWMEFAARRGDVDSLWKIEKFRSEAGKQHSLVTGFSCAKGFLLEHKPQNAAAIIELLNQTLPNKKRPKVVIELQKLVSEWPLEIMKHQKEDKRKGMTAALQNDIATMISTLSRSGLELDINAEELMNKQLA